MELHKTKFMKNIFLKKKLVFFSILVTYFPNFNQATLYNTRKHDDPFQSHIKLPIFYIIYQLPFPQRISSTNKLFVPDLKQFRKGIFLENFLNLEMVHICFLLKSVQKKKCCFVSWKHFVLWRDVIIFASVVFSRLG